MQGIKVVGITLNVLHGLIESSVRCEVVNHPFGKLSRFTDDLGNEFVSVDNGVTPPFLIAHETAIEQASIPV